MQLLIIILTILFLIGLCMVAIGNMFENELNNLFYHKKWGYRGGFQVTRIGFILTFISLVALALTCLFTGGFNH